MQLPKLFRFLASWLVFTFACGALAQGEASKVRFTILHINDVYEIMEVGGEGGLARVATLRKRLAQKNPNTMMVMAGDLFSPSALGTARVDGEPLAGKQIVAIMNRIGLNYMTFGNHEFDLNEERFKKRMAESQFQWFSSNVVNATGEPFPNVPANRIVEVANRQGKKIKVGFFGLTIPSNRKPYVRYLDVFQEAAKQVKLLRPQVEVLLAVTHLSFDEDRQLSEAFPQIDLIMGGHEHVRHAFEKGNLPPIYKADANVRSAYLHYFTYDLDVKKLKRTSLLQKVTPEIPEDKAVKREVEQWVKIAYDAFRKSGFEPEKRVVTSDVPLDGTEESVRSKETPLTKLIVDGMLRETEGVELALCNGGAIRIDDTLLPGPITEYDVIRVLPFGGKVVATEIRGDLLARLLDQSLLNRGTGGYLQTVNVSRNKEGDAWRIGDKPLDPDRLYRAAVLDFLLTGQEQNMGFFHKDAPGVNVLREGVDIRLALMNQLKRVFPEK